MDSLMRPGSIAVVGASQRASRGTRVVANLRNTGFAGDVFAINPRYQEVQGFRCYPAVSAVPTPVDCVVVAVPAPAVVDVLEDAFEAGTRGAVVLSSGFGEGGHDDAERISRLRSLAARGMSICGPNCYGILNVLTGAAAFSGPTDGLLAGPVAVVSQSGGFSTLISAPLMEDRGIGCSYIVSCGNQIGVPVERYLEYLVEDENTKVVAAFVEGFRRADLLPGIGARARELGKPIIILKSGRSERGRAAVMSHTGSLAGRTDILSALLRRHGIIQVETIDQLVETASLMATANLGRKAGRTMVVITGSGGESSHVADAADVVDLELAALTPVTTQRIQALLPDFGVAGNPVDGTGAMFENPELFPALLSAVLDDPQDSIVAINLGSRAPRSESAPAPMRTFATAVAQAVGATDKLVVAYGTSSLGTPDVTMVTALRDAGVPYLSGTEGAVRALSALVSYRDFLRSPFDVPARTPADADRREGTLPFLEARSVLAEFGIPIVQTVLATTPGEAADAADRLGYPVVVKAEAPGLVHKSDIGGVVVGCRDASAVEQAFRSVSANVRAAGFEQLTGVLVQPMPPSVAEAMVGVLVDPDLGPAVVVGLGGIFVELIRDTVTDIPPFTREQARSMILRIKASGVLQGARGAAPADIDALADLVVAVGDFAVAHREHLASVDLNPVLVGTHGAVAVDAVVEFRNAD